MKIPAKASRKTACLQSSSGFFKEFSHNFQKTLAKKKEFIYNSNSYYYYFEEKRR
jgi:hypothetical protein